MMLFCKYCGKPIRVNTRINKNKLKISNYHIDCFIENKKNDKQDE